MDAAGAVIWMEFRFANDMVSLKCPSLCYLAPEANWSSLSQGLASFWEISGVREKGGKVSRYSCSFALWSIHRFLKQRGLGINIYRSSDGTGSIDTEWERAWWIIIIHLEYLLPPLSSSLKWRWAQGEQRRVEWRRRRAEAERERERQTERAAGWKYIICPCLLIWEAEWRCHYSDMQYLCREIVYYFYSEVHCLMLRGPFHNTYLMQYFFQAYSHYGCSCQA